MDNVSNFNKNLSKYGLYLYLSTWLLPVATIAITYNNENDIFHQVDRSILYNILIAIYTCNIVYLFMYLII